MHGLEKSAGFPELSFNQHHKEIQSYFLSKKDLIDERNWVH